MKNLTIRNIVSAVGGEFHGDSAILDREISAVSTDSREISPDCLFAAIKGERSDGNDYIEASLEKGALCAIGQRVPESGTAVIAVPDTVRALGDLAKFYRSCLDIKIIGVTGSVGKTTTKEMVSAVLSQRFKVHKTPKNLNNDLGVPLTLFGLEESHQVAVVEMGISHFGEMARLSEIVQPDMAIYSTIGASHLEFLGDLDGVLKEKSQMVNYLPAGGTVFINGDDAMLRKLSYSGKICAYGLAPDCNVRAENVKLRGTDGMELEVVSGVRRFAAEINSFGVHMVTAALGAAAIGMELGLTDSEIAAGIAAYRPVGSRSSIIKTEKLTIIDDCYNANPTSTAAALKSLSMLSGRRAAILGDMGELGENSAELHRQTGENAGRAGTDMVIACGALSKNTADGAVAAGVGEVHYFEDKAALLPKLSKLIKAGDTVLVKASHSQAFEEMVQALKAL